MIRPLMLLAAAGLSGIATQAAADDPLAAYHWISRVLVVAAPNRGDLRLDEQLREAMARRHDFSERDLVVVEAVGNTDEARHLRGRFGIAPGEFRVVLVGKDGESKLSQDAPIPSARLFSTIDAMPMRRDEQERR